MRRWHTAFSTQNEYIECVWNEMAAADDDDDVRKRKNDKIAQKITCKKNEKYVNIYILRQDVCLCSHTARECEYIDSPLMHH